MSPELIHLMCWMLLAAMTVLLLVGGARTFRELREVLRERRLRRALNYRPAYRHGKAICGI
ncbi:hypothetical protein [Iodidimonas sp. SYSU 1G8]|uniref:hypothetical protein n=1 Tax=Iodidimonas sp. SYSU 1G8 TaxID=3133967 RepID=UPI0031FEBAE2